MYVYNYMYILVSKTELTVHFACCVEPVLNDLKFDLKLCMDKIRTLAMGKNKDINVSIHVHLQCRRFLIFIYLTT